MALLFNPSDINDGLEYGFYGAIGVAAVAGTLATGGTILQGGVAVAMPTFTIWGTSAIIGTVSAAQPLLVSAGAGLFRDKVELSIRFATQRGWPFIRSVGHSLQYHGNAAARLSADSSLLAQTRRHKATHVLDAMKHPIAFRYTQGIGNVSLPGSTLLRSVFELRAYGIENGPFQIQSAMQFWKSIPPTVPAWDAVYTYLLLRTGGTMDNPMDGNEGHNE